MNKIVSRVLKAFNIFLILCITVSALFMIKAVNLGGIYIFKLLPECKQFAFAGHVTYKFVLIILLSLFFARGIVFIFNKSNLRGMFFHFFLWPIMVVVVLLASNAPIPESDIQFVGRFFCSEMKKGCLTQAQKNDDIKRYGLGFVEQSCEYLAIKYTKQFESCLRKNKKPDFCHSEIMNELKKGVGVDSAV